MGVDRSGTYLRGILVPDPRITADHLVSKAHATVPSAYTEAGPFAGPPRPDQGTDLILRTSGSQTADGDVEIRTQRAGGVGLGEAGFVWRDVAAGDMVTEYKGVDPPAIVTAWETLLYTTAAQGANPRPDVIRLASGKLLAFYSVTQVGVVSIARYDPATSAWTDASLSPTGAGAGYTLTGVVTLCQLSSGRILAFCLAIVAQQVDVYYSDDDGDNWTPGGYRVLVTGVKDSTITDMRARYSPETQEILLIALWTDGANLTAAQYASADLGSAFTRVVSDFRSATGAADNMVAMDIIPRVGGGFCVLYIDTEGVGTDVLHRRILSSAFDHLDAADEAEPDASIVLALDDVTGWADEDGVMWLLVADGTTGGGNRIGAMSRSTDQGDTWEDAADVEGTHALHLGSSTTTTNRLHSYSAASIGGRTALVTRWVAAGSAYDPMSVGVVWYGGHSTQTAPGARAAWNLSNDDFQDTHYIAWGQHGSANRPGGFWIPAEVPTSVDWTGVGAGSEILAAGALVITTAAGQTRSMERVIPDDSVTGVFLDFEVDIDAGDGSLLAEEIALTVRLSDGTYQYEVQVRLSDAGYQLYDLNAAAAVGVAQAFDLTTPGHIRLALDDHGDVRTWHARAAHNREWAEGAKAEGLTDGGAGAVSNLIRWGHSGAGANSSRWTLVGFCFWPGRWAQTYQTEIGSSALDNSSRGWKNPSALHPRSFPTGHPALVHDGARIEAVGGPSFVGETQRIGAAYEYPVRAIHPDTSPSPARAWRATTHDVDYALVWDLESEAGFADSFWESTTLGCFLVGSNLQRAKLQGWDGAAWQDIIVLDASKGYADLPAIRKGRIVYPDTSGAPPTAERWSPHEMHAGDTLQLDDGEFQVLRRIASNSEGGWRSGTKLARLALDPDTLTGSEATAFGATIFRRNFGGVVHNVSAAYRYVRLFIGRQKTVDGYYRIGSLAIGPVFVFGLQPGNGWAWERAANTELVTRDSGVRSSRVRGARRRAVEVSWSTQPQDTSRMWDSAPTPDYVTGVTAGDPVASIADTAYQVLGLLERTEGGDAPVVYLSRIARGAGSHVYTLDPEWIYGRITTETASLDHVVGDEGVSPALRGNRLRVEEEV